MSKGGKDHFDINPPNPPNEGILFIDHSQTGRSGHLGHALVEYDNGKILAFYPNCSSDNKGHSAVGWMEYKRSIDAGMTWSEPYILDYSKMVLDQGKGISAMCEKAVISNNRDIILFNLICDISENALWEPQFIPTYIRSQDGGHTWTDAKDLGDEPGRVYDAISHNNNIYALQFCNDGSEHYLGINEEHIYRLYISKDNGKTFKKLCDLPFCTKGRGYGALQILKDNNIIVYIYNKNDEKNLDYIISKDNGCTWTDVKTSYLAKKIRNPQIALVGDYFFLHGRSGHYGHNSGNFVLYFSKDGMNWDSGRYLKMQDAFHGAYSNNLVVGKFDTGKPEKLLIQASHAYEQYKTNICHWWIKNISGTK